MAYYNDSFTFYLSTQQCQGSKFQGAMAGWMGRIEDSGNREFIQKIAGETSWKTSTWGNMIKIYSYNVYAFFRE
jgi:hypothetical protein